MIEFTILNSAGQVVRYGTCMVDMLSAQAGPGEQVVEGIIEYVPDEPIYNYTYHRIREYPPVGEQLDAVYKMVVAIQGQGIKLPDETLKWLDDIQNVKDTYPKGGN